MVRSNEEKDSGLLATKTETSPLVAGSASKDVEEDADALETQKKKLDEPDSKPVRKSFSDSIRQVLIHLPKPNPCLLFFYLIELVTVLSSLALLATQLIPIIVAPPDELGFTQFALRVYLASFCVTFVLVELRVPLPFLLNNKMFQNWMSRGIIYSFVGLIGIEQAYSTRVEDVFKHASSKFHIGWTPLFMQISSWTMVAVGYLYVFMGVLCLKQLREKLQEDYQERIEEYTRGEPIDEGQ